MKNGIKMAMGLFIISAISLSPPFLVESRGQEAPPPKADPDDGIEKREKRVEDLRRDLDSRYDYSNVAGTLEKAFRERGVTGKTVLGYAAPWGGWLYLDWSSLMAGLDKAFRQIEADKQAARRATKAIRSKAVDQYQESLSKFEKRLMVIDRSMKAVVLLYAERAYWKDEDQKAWKKQWEIKDRYFKLWAKNTKEYNRRHKYYESQKRGELRPWEAKEKAAAKKAYDWGQKITKAFDSIKKGREVFPLEKSRTKPDPRPKDKGRSGKKKQERDGKDWKLSPPPEFDRDGDGKWDPPLRYR